MQRGMTYNNRSSSFSSWLESQKQDGGEKEPESDISIWMQLGSIQESFVGQMQELTGSLPDAGPLSSAYRARLLQAIYLLGASIGFAILTVVIGIPTLVVRPSKFVLCLTLATIFAASSVIVMQKPSVFFSELLTGGLPRALPVALLTASTLFTLYTTIFVHRYIVTLAAGAVQTVCLLFYLASFIPGGMKGLLVVLRMLYAIVYTASKPVLFILQKIANQIIRSLCSS